MLGSRCLAPHQLWGLLRSGASSQGRGTGSWGQFWENKEEQEAELTVSLSSKEPGCP